MSKKELDLLAQVYEASISIPMTKQKNQNQRKRNIYQFLTKPAKETCETFSVDRVKQSPQLPIAELTPPKTTV